MFFSKLLTYNLLPKVKNIIIPLLLSASYNFCFGQLIMTSSNIPRAGVISINTELTFEFNQQLDISNIANSLRVNSKFRGLIAGNTTVTGNVLKFKPLFNFEYGEEITITILKGLKSITAQSITSPISIQSHIETKASQATPPAFLDREVFIEPDQNLRVIVAADLDRDSDIDLVLASDTVKWFENIGKGAYNIHTISEGLTFIPYEVKVVDFDSDGDQDIISSDWSSVRLLLNDGNQSFTSKILLENVQALSFEVIDFDSNGFLDVVLIDNTPDSAQHLVLYNLGNSFIEQKILNRGGYDLRLIDFDFDGDWDILVSDDTGLSYFKNVNEEFSSAFLISSNPVFDFNVRDYDGDGDYDIACIGETSVDLHVQTSPGNFVEKEIQSVGRYDGKISSGDFDGDDDIDIVVPHYNGFNLLINNGNADFQSTEVQNFHSQYGLGFEPTHLTIADLDSDGDLDFCSILNWLQIKSYINTTLGEAYPFSSVQSIFDHFSYGDSDWADFDNDGDMDLLISGLQDNQPKTRLYRNENGQFEKTEVQLPGVYLGSCDWGDFDNDGDFDILLMGATSTNLEDRQPITVIYSNTGGKFSSLSIANLQGAFDGEARWADFDNDGKLDVIVVGSFGVQLYRSQDGNSFTIIEETMPQIFGSGNIDIADYDGDGDQDIALSGWGGNNGAVLKVIQNNGNWSFFMAEGNFMGRIGGSVNWVDIDNDGDMDVIASGIKFISSDQWVPSNTVYRNVEGSFAEVENTTLLFYTNIDGTAAIGDFDNNGVPDLIASKSGSTSDQNLTMLRNDGNGNLSPVDMNLPNIESRTANWIDFDRDHDLDIFVQTQLLRNNVEYRNSRPEPPNQIQVDSVFNNTVYYHWNFGSDKETVTAGLSYQSYVGTSSKSQDVINSNSDLATGIRRVSEHGMVKGTRSKATSLDGGQHYIGVQSIDATFEGSVFSEEVSVLVIGISGPTSSCRDLSASYVARPTGSYNWQITGGTLIYGQGTDSIRVTWNQIGTGYVKIQNNDNDKNTLVVEVDQKPQPQIIGDPTVCSGAEKYEVIDPLSISFLWKTSQSSAISSPKTRQTTVNWEVTGLQKVFVYAFPKNLGCMTTDSLTVLVDKRPVPKLAGVTVTCTQYVDRYQADVENALWTVDNGIIQKDSGKSILINWNKAGDGFVSVKSYSKNNYCTVSDTVKVKVLPSPAKPILKLMGDTLISPPSPINYFEWYLDQELVLSGPYIGLITGGTLGAFQVAIFNLLGCRSISDPFLITEVEDESKIDDIFSVYPNPYSEAITIELESQNFGSVRVLIFSMSGKQVLQESFDKKEIKFQTVIKTPAMGDGIYLVNIIIGDKILVKKIVKK